jgi:hypothetical protein
MNKPTRHLPLIFAGGQPDKVRAIRKLLPDAVYTDWTAITEALEKAIRQPPADPVVPKSIMDSYAGRPLVQKLGIKAGSTVALVGAPKDFEKTLGGLPEGTVLKRGMSQRADLILWFNRSSTDLEEGMKSMVEFIGDGALWIIWPKKSSGIESDLSQTTVRKTGLNSGLVDYKVCAVDQTWSGLLFTRRKGG